MFVMPDLSLSKLSVVIQATAHANPRARAEWSITWTIKNESLALLSVHELRIPHDQFRATDALLDPPISIQPGDMGSINSIVIFAEPPGSTLTYPFIILRATWNGLACRLFGRLRVEADEHGVPHPICEEVTVRPLPPER